MPLTKLHPCFCFANLLLFFNATTPHANEKVVTMPMTLKSSAFTDQNKIPKLFTCDGQNIDQNLGLRWLAEKHLPYLQYHRRLFFEGCNIA